MNVLLDDPGEEYFSEQETCPECGLLYSVCNEIAPYRKKLSAAEKRIKYLCEERQWMLDAHNAQVAELEAKLAHWRECFTALHGLLPRLQTANFLDSGQAGIADRLNRSG